MPSAAAAPRSDLQIARRKLEKAGYRRPDQVWQAIGARMQDGATFTAGLAEISRRVGVRPREVARWLVEPMRREPPGPRGVAGLMALLGVLAMTLIVLARAAAVLGLGREYLGSAPAPLTASQVVAVRPLPALHRVVAGDVAIAAVPRSFGGLYDTSRALGRYTLAPVPRGKVLHAKDLTGISATLPSGAFVISVPLARDAPPPGAASGESVQLLLAPRIAGTSALRVTAVLLRSENGGRGVTLAMSPDAMARAAPLLGSSEAYVVRAVR